MKHSIVFFAIPFFFLLIGLELLYFYIKKQKYYRLNDSIANLSMGVGNQVINALTKTLVFGAYIWTYDHFTYFRIPTNAFTIVICFVLYDFIYYWSHRWGHTISFFWGAHSVHHQSEEFNLSVALRQPWFHNLIAFYLFLPMALLGFDPKLVGLIGGVNLLYQFWIHTEIIRKMPRWFEYVFNTPSHHRVHHAINPEYLDRNHAGVLMIWDRMFGTFEAEKEDGKIRYGVTKTFGSWNPAWANVQFYTELWTKMKLVSSVGEKITLIFHKPGWNPVLKMEEVVLDPTPAMVKYDKDASTFTRIYCFVQFAILLIGSVMYLGQFGELSWIYKGLFAGLILFSIEIIGGIFENKRWALYGEYVRLTAIVLGLNWFYYNQYPVWLTYTLVFSIAGALISFGIYTYSLQASFAETEQSVA